MKCYLVTESRSYEYTKVLMVCRNKGKAEIEVKKLRKIEEQRNQKIKKYPYTLYLSNLRYHIEEVDYVE